MLRADKQSNLGWRILLDVDKPTDGLAAIRESIEDGSPLVDGIPEPYRNQRLAEAFSYVDPEVEQTRTRVRSLPTEN
jgi:hypothetical protein